MRRQVDWSNEAGQDLSRFVDALPGRHEPPNPDALAEDVALIVETLANHFDEQEDYGPGLKRVALQEPLAAGLITVFARLVDPHIVEIITFDAWPPGQPDEPTFD